MKTTEAGGPKLLSMAILWRPDSLKILGAKIWTKEILSTTSKTFKHHFLVLLVAFLLFLTFWRLTPPWGKRRPLCLWKKGLERWMGRKQSAQCSPISQKLRMITTSVIRESGLSQLCPQVQLARVALRVILNCRSVSRMMPIKACNKINLC